MKETLDKLNNTHRVYTWYIIQTENKFLTKEYHSRDTMEDVGSGMMLSHPSRRNEELVKNAELLALQRLDGMSSLFPLSLSFQFTQLQTPQKNRSIFNERDDTWKPWNVWNEVSFSDNIFSDPTATKSGTLVRQWENFVICLQ